MWLQAAPPPGAGAYNAPNSHQGAHCTVIGRMFGLAGLPPAVRRALVVAYATSMASNMGVNLVYPLLPAMIQQLGVDEASVGLVVTAYTAPAIVLAPIAGVVADLYGRKRLLFWGMLLFGLAGASVALAPTLEWVLALRFLQGMASSALFPLTIVLLSDVLEGDQETSGQGLKVVLDRVATALLPVAAGALAAVAWSTAYYLYLVTIPVAFLSLWWTPERVRTGGSMAGYFRAMAAAGGNRKIVAAYGAGFLRFFLDYGYFTYVPIYLAVTRGTPPLVVGQVLACYAVGAMITASQAGRLARGRDPGLLVCAAFLVDGVAALAVPLLPNEALVGAALFAYGLGNGIISPLQKSVLTRNGPRHAIGGVIAVDRMLQQTAKTLSPTLMGLLLVAADVTAVFWVLGALSTLSIPLAALMITRREAATAVVEPGATPPQAPAPLRDA